MSYLYSFLKNCFAGLFFLFILIIMAGCVASSQEWEHASSIDKGHVLVPGHMRWYQYNHSWFNLGGKPPAGLGGIIYTLTTPSDWFWYGPYNQTRKEKFKAYYKVWCPDCKSAYYRCIEQIKEIQAKLKIYEENGDTENAKLCRWQIQMIHDNNFISDDLTESFEDQFR